MSVPLTSSDLERRDVSGKFFEVDLLHDTSIVWSRTTKFGR